MKTILLATGNQNKAREIKNLLDNVFEVVTMKDYGIAIDIIEDGLTYEENALIKVRALKPYVLGKDIILMGDDSGLSVDYLNGAPGIYSARYAGEDVDYAANNKKLLAVMKDVPAEKRGAAFICVIAILFPDGRELTFRGEVRGTIAFDYTGTGGFGYDPIFIHQDTGRAYAQMSDNEKNRLSHRAAAIAKAKPLLLNNK
ncbi:RdgB/HAM1 family non-canonical purine NTP pyrophosphatase [Acetobacterium bakii]|uniref:dITP/XTP pyrophosphatase n=1 Tax=Acetobacterium bakii TaxID=52689 RepID=A0A0L6U3D7_9FIRM|nr:RdgB/HAM1 family non-canonical purine NTP pyrophosphatase [Acetobacterium bakii]KNZ43031.1 NTP phosphatase [Acetobacterium bakii]